MYKFGKKHLEQKEREIKFVEVKYDYKEEAKKDNCIWNVENKMWFIYKDNENYDKLVKKWNVNNFRYNYITKKYEMINK